MKNGYYLVRDTTLDNLTCYDIAAWDDDVKAWTFCGDDMIHSDIDRWEVVKYICDPECTELR